MFGFTTFDPDREDVHYKHISAKRQSLEFCIWHQIFVFESKIPPTQNYSQVFECHRIIFVVFHPYYKKIQLAEVWNCLNCLNFFLLIHSSNSQLKKKHNNANWWWTEDEVEDEEVDEEDEEEEEEDEDKDENLVVKTMLTTRT